MKHKAILLSLLSLGSGCAPAPGEITDSQLVWAQKTIPIGYEAAYRNIQDSLRICRSSTQGEGALYHDIKEGRIDLFAPDPLGGKSAWFTGKIIVTSVGENSTEVKAGFVKAYDTGNFIGSRKAGDLRKWALDASAGSAPCPM